MKRMILSKTYFRSIRDYLSEKGKAIEVLDSYNRDQVEYVCQAYDEATANLSDSKEIKIDYAAGALEDELFETPAEFERLWDAIETLKSEDAIANS